MTARAVIVKAKNILIFSITFYIFFTSARTMHLKNADDNFFPFSLHLLNVDLFSDSVSSVVSIDIVKAMKISDLLLPRGVVEKLIIQRVLRIAGDLW